MPRAWALVRTRSTGLGHGPVELDQLVVGLALGALEAGQRDQVLHERAEPGRLALGAGGEAPHRDGVVGGVLERLAQQPQRRRPGS